MMKIIVTGATGFLGRNLAESLHSEGMQVIATGRSPEVGARLRSCGIRFIPANIEDASQVIDAISPSDCVIHCAGKSGGWGSYRDFYAANVIGSRHVIDACKKKGINKIVFISSPTIYYNGKDRYNISEADPLPAQKFHYGKTKLLTERELLALEKDGFKTIILRPRAVYGKYEINLMPRILRLAERKNLPLINGGRAIVDMTYVGNFVSAVRDCLSAPDDAWNDVYNISNGEPISLRDCFAQVLELFGRPFRPKAVSEPAAKAIAMAMELASMLLPGNKEPELTRFGVGYMGKSMTMSIDKARRRLNYSPKTSNKEGFKLYRDWYRQENLADR